MQEGPRSRDRYEVLADMIDAGRNALQKSDLGVRQWAKRWLQWSWPTARSEWYIEATWIVLHNPEGYVDPGPPTALPATAEPIAFRRTASLWRSPPKDPVAYLKATIAREAAKLKDLYGETKELGYADLEQREVNLRAVRRRERGASWELEKRVDLDQLDERAAEPVSFDPPGEVLRNLGLARFTKSERERHYLILLALHPGTKADAQCEAGITRSEAIALEARIRRGTR